MSDQKQTKTEKCPNCGHPYDPEKDTVIECLECGEEGSTACCLPAGRGVPCAKCEEAYNHE